MTTVEHGAELARAGANITTRRQALLFLARRYPLGAVGALIMLLFVLTALFASFIEPYDPTSTNARGRRSRCPASRTGSAPISWAVTC